MGIKDPSLIWGQCFLTAHKTGFPLKPSDHFVLIGRGVLSKHPTSNAQPRSRVLTLGPKRGDDLFETRIAAQRFPEGMEFEPGVIDVAGHRYQLLQ